MATLFGKNYTKTELRKRIGDISQIGGATEFTYSQGKANAVKAIEVRNGSSLKFVILPDRGMDIAYAEYKGVPISYISKTGIVSSSHYDEPDFLRSFSAGLLTTCGLTYMGAPCKDNGIELGAHGRISNIPAYDVGIVQEWQDDDFIITVRGKVREATVFGENIVLTRTITTKLGENKIHIQDEIENEGFEPTPLMVLYHMNFGFPLISSATKFKTNCVNTRPRDEEAEKGIKNTCEFSEPIKNYKEQVFYRDAVQNSYAELINKDIDLSVKLEFNGEELPYLIEWKQMGEQEYVVGLEPATYPPDSRAKAREKNELLFLQGQETKNSSIVINVNSL